MVSLQVTMIQVETYFNPDFHERNKSRGQTVNMNSTINVKISLSAPSEGVTNSILLATFNRSTSKRSQNREYRSKRAHRSITIH